MTNTERMNVSQSPETLICIKFHQDHWHFFFAFVVVLQNTEDRLLYVIHDNIEINLVLLITLGIESMLELDHIWMEEFFHNLKLSVFVPLVLVNLFDGNFLICFILFVVNLDMIFLL